MVAKEDVARMLDYNIWANHRLMRAAATLSVDDFKRDTLGASHGGVRGTLTHIMGGEWIWLERWKGVSHTRLFDEGDFADVVTLRDRWTLIEDHRDEWFRGLREDSLGETVRYRTTEGVPYEAPLWKLMQHVLNHSTYHAWSPDGGRIAFLSDRSGKAEIFVMNGDGTDVLQLTDDTEGAGWWPRIRWSTDGSRLLNVRSFTFSDAWTRAEVHIIQADGSGMAPLYPDQRMAHNDYLAEWLPLGNGVDFLTFRYTSNAVFTVALDGSQPRGLFVRGSEPVLAFAGSPNEGEVALVTRGPDRRGQQFDYRTLLRLLGRESGVEFATPNIDRLDSMGEFELVWSPQGDRIAFPATQLHGGRELWMWFRECPTDLDRCVVPVTDLGAIDGRATWSPDGRWLAFASGTAEAFDIYAVKAPEFWSPNVGPEIAMHLASSEGWDFAPVWRPSP